jgi:hypothetical protein
MKEAVFTKQKSLSQLQYLLEHYKQVYPQAKHRGKIVLRQYFKRVNFQVQHLQFRSQSKTRS